MALYVARCPIKVADPTHFTLCTYSKRKVETLESEMLSPSIRPEQKSLHLLLRCFRDKKNRGQGRARYYLDTHVHKEGSCTNTHYYKLAEKCKSLIKMNSRVE